MAAARRDPRLEAACRAMREAGKPPKIAIVATGRRLVTIADALIREDITFGQSRSAT